VQNCSEISHLSNVPLANGMDHTVRELSNFAQQQRRISDRFDGRSQRRPPSEVRDISSRLRKVIRTAKPVIAVLLFDLRSRTRFLPHMSQALQISGPGDKSDRRSARRGAMQFVQETPGGNGRMST
jgi:hypothetical protein